MWPPAPMVIPAATSASGCRSSARSNIAGEANMRAAFVLIHRFVGLTIAAFLFVSGVTGAIISWDHELDELINPHLVEAPGRGAFLDPLVLADKLAADEPNSYVTYVPLHPEEGHSLDFGVEAKFDPATQDLYATGYNQVFIDPVTGA